MRTCFVIPAYQAQGTVGAVVEGLRHRWPTQGPEAFVVVDDGSTDGTAEVAARAGATVLRRDHNGGKGAALRDGLDHAASRGFDVVVTVDADGQHTPEGAARVWKASDDAGSLVLGVRDLAGAGAPRANRFSNAVSNTFLSLFTGRRLRDTQCGLRRYPVGATRALGARARGYAFEAEVLLRAVAAQVPVVSVDVPVVYPQGRTSHFHVMKDPARIIGVVLRTLVILHRRLALLAAALSLVAAGPWIFHLGVAHLTAVTAPFVATPALPAAVEHPTGSGILRTGPSYARRRAGIREVYLEGSPPALGEAHGRLVGSAMAVDEAELWTTFRRVVPLAPVRTLLVDMGRLRYRGLAGQVPASRLEELAAESAIFARQGDPYAGELPTFQRLLFLHGLYDIALGFEHSPLIGCSITGVTASATENGHTRVARAFDFEAGEALDRDKAVYLVRGAEVRRGRQVLPFASVAWPGLVGVVTGMNVEGVFVAVNGARAGEPRATGTPVVFSLRSVLEEARTTDEAVTLLSAQEVMVSHLVFVADAAGHFAAVERAPGVAATVRREAHGGTFALTNHFEGPLARDPRDATVRAQTSTLARRARLDAWRQALPAGGGTVEALVDLLRDRTCPDGRPCPPGDRRALDAGIATHGVVADTTAKVLWVSAGPHLDGAFVAFDLQALFAADHDPAADPMPSTLPARTASSALPEVP